MNTIIDLNTTANITYNTQSSYAISFGTNAGNASVTIDEDETHALQKQTPLNSITSPVRDLLVDIQFSGYAANAFPVTGISYAGTWGNISLMKMSPSLWRWYGIRSVAQYNEAFANTVLGTAYNYTSNTYAYTTSVTDQMGNNRSWSTNVTLLDAPVVVVTGNVVYNEDIRANVNNVNIVSVNPQRVYTFTANATGIGVMANSTSNATAVTLSGNITSLNSQITANNLAYLPAHNYSASGGNITFSLSASGNTYRTGNITTQIGNTHTNYVMGTSIVTTEDTAANIRGFAISDFATQHLANGAPYTYTITLEVDPAFGRLYYTGNSTYANALSFTNTKASINAIFSGNTVSYLPYTDIATTGNIRYTQTSVEDSLLQANVLLPVTVTNAHSEYSITTALNYAEDTAQSMIFDITDTDAYVNNYSIVWTQVSPNPATYPGRFAVNGVANTLGANVTITDSRANINAANVYYQPPSNWANAIVLNYSQQVNTQQFGNISQGNSNVTLTNTSTTADYNALAANTISFIRDRVSLNNWSIPENDIAPVFGTRTYTWTLNNVSNVGNIWLNGVRQSSNVITLTGNKTTINTSLANVSSYWEETANAAFTTAGLTTANTVFNFNLDRTGPDARVLAANVVSNVTVNVPSSNDTRNNLTWQGGFYTGQNNGNVVTVVWPYIAGNVGTTFGSDIAGYTYRFTTASSSSVPADTANTGAQGYENTEYLAGVGYSSPNVCIQAAYWPSVTTKNNFSDWYLPAADEVLATRAELGSRVGGGNIWTSTVISGNVYIYNQFAGGISEANTYTNLRTQTGGSIQTATTMPQRRVWTQSNYYNIPTTNTATRGVDYELDNWWVGLPSDGYTYQVNLNCDSGFFVNNNVSNVGNTYTRNNITGGTKIRDTSLSAGPVYIPPVTGNTANVTISVTRNDGLVVLNSATRQITLNSPNIGDAWFGYGGYYGGEFDSTGGSSPDVYLVYAFSAPPSSTQFVPISVNVAMPAINSQYDGPNNSTALYSSDSGNMLAVGSALSYSANIWGQTFSDWYLPSINEVNTANVPGWSSTVNLDTNPTRPRKVAYNQSITITNRGNITFQEMYASGYVENVTPMRRIPK